MTFDGDRAGGQTSCNMLENLTKLLMNQTFGVKLHAPHIILAYIHTGRSAVGVNRLGFESYRVNGTINIDLIYHWLALAIIRMDQRYICCNRPAFKPDRVNETAYSGTFWQIHSLWTIRRLIHPTWNDKLSL